MPEPVITAAAATTAPLASEIPAPVGKIPQFLAAWFGPDYRTAISGNAAGVGVILLGLVPFMSGNTAKILAAIGMVLTGGGIQQMGTNARDAKNANGEPK